MLRGSRPRARDHRSRRWSCTCKGCRLSTPGNRPLCSPCRRERRSSCCTSLFAPRKSRWWRNRSQPRSRCRSCSSLDSSRSSRRTRMGSMLSDGRASLLRQCRTYRWSWRPATWSMSGTLDRTPCRSRSRPRSCPSRTRGTPPRLCIASRGCTPPLAPCG